jgi:hypothetical protein
MTISFSLAIDPTCIDGSHYCSLQEYLEADPYDLSGWNKQDNTFDKNRVVIVGNCTLTVEQNMSESRQRGQKIYAWVVKNNNKTLKERGPVEAANYLKSLIKKGQCGDQYLSCIEPLVIKKKVKNENICVYPMTCQKENGLIFSFDAVCGVENCNNVIKCRNQRGYSSMLERNSVSGYRFARHQGFSIKNCKAADGFEEGGIELPTSTGGLENNRYICSVPQCFSDLENNAKTNRTIAYCSRDFEEGKPQQCPSYQDCLNKNKTNKSNNLENRFRNDLFNQGESI